MKLYSFPCASREPHELFAALSRHSYSLFFDSADRHHELARYSYIVFDPIETIEAKNGTVCIRGAEGKITLQGRGIDCVRDRLKIHGLDKRSHDHLPPFQGGAAGLFGYDLTRDLEKLPAMAQDNPEIPDMAVGIYDQVFGYDHQQKTGWFIVHAEDKSSARTHFDHFIQLTGETPGQGPATSSQRWQSSHTRREYERAVQRVIDYIHAGDIFQCNLSQRFESRLPEGFDTWAHYLRLRQVNAAPFAAFMNFGAVKISSASPERFLLVRDRRVESRPIKGTQKRDRNEAADRLNRARLENSAKDRAENMMIVDLLRNDLSKVCEDDSVEVPVLCRLESFAKVHHLVSVIEATLKTDQEPADLLQACFPGGSITGAPKVRAMQIIEEMESKRRGPYCGTLGYIGYDGAMDTNIAIRTLVYQGNTVSFNVGGGIVADSVTAIEYEETLSKAEAIFDSFEAAADNSAPATAP
ncbi:aminodeoxychorismate synthase component I [Kineobactrum salinum]|uniref:aminodeoxychorismate synthase n=1 Tax=Kineobactrum salinum TaxID=2708301 RepID=A0A6C0U390_9GAMM|nr:aminodeoxychorismate synthase component I [Kineobactrum salinum]QIB66486.1 aminodeoxychorismate synthase component I [Kineobactrum salinum]